jgi:hypothetical protein
MVKRELKSGLRFVFHTNPLACDGQWSIKITRKIVCIIFIRKFLVDWSYTPVSLQNFSSDLIAW